MSKPEFVKLLNQYFASHNEGLRHAILRAAEFPLVPEPNGPTASERVLAVGRRISLTALGESKLRELARMLRGLP